MKALFMDLSVKNIPIIFYLILKNQNCPNCCCAGQAQALVPHGNCCSMACFAAYMTVLTTAAMMNWTTDAQNWNYAVVALAPGILFSPVDPELLAQVLLLFWAVIARATDVVHLLPAARFAPVTFPYSEAMGLRHPDPQPSVLEFFFRWHHHRCATLDWGWGVVC
jgi:hypothetical protein